jgi:hypothetical protein
LNGYKFPDDSPECLKANEAVRHLGDRAVPLLTRWITQPGSSFRTKILTFFSDKLPLPAVFYAAEDRDAIAACGFAVLGTNGAGALPKLVDALHSAPQCAFISDAFLSIGPKSVPVLTNAVSDADSRMRQAAVGILRDLVAGLKKPGARSPEMNSLVDTSVVPALLRAMDDADAVVRMEAIEALGRCRRQAQAQTIVTSLTKALGDADPSVRRRAASALGGFGPDARISIPMLKVCLADPDIKVGIAASNAIVKIEQEKAFEQLSK